MFVKPNPQKKHKPWVYGEVIGNYPAPRVCLVSTPLGPIRHNHRPVRSALTKPSDSYAKRPNDFDTASLPETDSRTAEQSRAEQSRQNRQFPLHPRSQHQRKLCVRMLLSAGRQEIGKCLADSKTM